ncbi:MAG TPA: 16S rRNA (guanine(527)-N(7))-methyltransferase RsmG [Methylomirabilota bacterium]|jgi:16S rRNA (guanine527-N7)-methyltransferase|nr:16S rRNA (guanine(527)-N(7))-methyltransferase RsmG [Methylomirabilota bacterium]
MGRPASAEERRLFGRYLDLLLQWNRVHRLTGLEAPSAIVRELFRDSLLFLTRLPLGPLRLADIGAGAGIPGVPLRIVRPDISLTLIESKRKSVSFLESLKRELGMPDVRVLEGRAEELLRSDPELSGQFDVVVTRAVGPLRRLLPVARRYLRPGGRFIASGPPPGATDSWSTPESPVDVEALHVPELDLRRTFLTASTEDS